MKVETKTDDGTSSEGVWFKNQDEFDISVAPSFKMSKNWSYGTMVLRESVVQKKTGHQRDGVVAARHLDPRIVVRGERSLQTAAELQLVALLADGGALGTVAGAVEILHLHGDRPDRIVESHLVLPHVDLVDRKLGRSNGSSQKGRQKQEQRTIFHNAEIL